MRFGNAGWLCWVLFAGMLSARGQVSVEGVQDQQTLSRQATFRVVVSDGAERACQLNGRDVPAGAWMTVDRPDYYELLIRRPGAETIEGRVRFAVLDPERGETEWGLRTWTPRPAIDSSSEELATGRLRLVAPARYPTGQPIPLVALLEDDAGSWPRLNGTVRLEGHPQESFRLRRGAGSGFVTASAVAGAWTRRAQLGGQALEVQGQVEATANWLTIGADLTNDTVWPADAFVRVTRHIVVGEGATLTVEAGAVVMLDAGVEIYVDGKLDAQGTRERPVVFAPADASRPWGGLILRRSPAELTASGAIFTGSGADPNWFASHGLGGSHRQEEPLCCVGGGARADFVDCYVVDLHGQAFHGEAGTLTLDRCLVRGCQTAGQFNEGSVRISRSVLTEFPSADSTFADGDNDALYLNLGEHDLTNSVIGWTKDDGIDAGADAGGTVRVRDCWFEACFHEGMALSGEGKQVSVADSVFLNCGQGVEAGYGAPQVRVDRCLITGNGVGARFGDNYLGVHRGFLWMTNSLSLFNQRDVWGFDRGLWEEHVEQMRIDGNWLTAANSRYPSNRVWRAEEDAALLAPFLPTAAGTIGVGFAQAASELVIGTAAPSVVVGLSAFSAQGVAVDYEVTGGTAIEGRDFAVGERSVSFPAGSTMGLIPLSVLPAANGRDPLTIEFTLKRPLGTEVNADRATHVCTLIPSDRLRLSWEASGDGALRLRFNGQAGWSHRIEYREEAGGPAPWQSLAEFPSVGVETLQGASDQPLAAAPARIYRLVGQPVWWPEAP